MNTLTNFFGKMTMGVATLSLMTMVGCSKPAEQKTETKPAEEATPAAALNIKIATEGAYKPFNYVDANGKLAGFDVEIANALCAKMNANCEIVAQDWDGIIPGLMAKKYDAIIAGMSITKERSQVVDFTEPYFLNSLVFIGKKDATIDTSNLTKQNIGAQRSTVAAQHLEDNLAKTNTIKLYDSQENAYLDLKAGRATMMLSDKVPALDWLKTEDGSTFEIKGDQIDIDDKLAIAVRKNEDLKERFNTALADIKSDGTFQQISDKYFATN